MRRPLKSALVKWEKVTRGRYCFLEEKEGGFTSGEKETDKKEHSSQAELCLSSDVKRMEKVNLFEF